MLKTPIALFTYNRPTHTQLVLESLERCLRLEDCYLHIYCDGTKTSEHSISVEASRQIVRKWAPRLGAKIIERSENLGLARSVVAGVTELCDKYGRVIVIEDDLVVSPDFLDYMLQALEHYQNESQVYQISGYMYPVVHSPNPDAFFLPFTTSWGWATWKRAWHIVDWDAKGCREKLTDPQIRYRFDLNGSYPYSDILKQRLDGHNDSWAILWWWAVFNAQGLVLHPRQSLVWNGGFDGSGTHCDRSDAEHVTHLNQLDWSRLPSPLSLPSEVLVDIQAFDKICAFLKEQQKPDKVDLIVRLRRRLRQWYQVITANR